MGCAAFKAVEARLRAWWVRLLPLPPNHLPTLSFRIAARALQRAFGVNFLAKTWIPARLIVESVRQVSAQALAAL